jgi:uncharacterized membrane protein
MSAQGSPKVALWAATLTTGLMAGIFFAFSISVMPALARTDDAVFVPAMQNINAAIENVLFAVVFGGALIFSAVAAWQHRRTPVFRTVLAGLLLYVLTLGITMAVNVPLNEKLAADGLRASFENTWVWANIARTITCVAGFAALAWASLISRTGKSA